MRELLVRKSRNVNVIASAYLLSLLATTAMTVDRLALLIMFRYRQIVTLTRTHVVVVGLLVGCVHCWYCRVISERFNFLYRHSPVSSH